MYVASGHLSTLAHTTIPDDTTIHAIVMDRSGATSIACGRRSAPGRPMTTDELTCPECAAALHLPREAKSEDHVYCPTCIPDGEERFADKIARKQELEAGREDRLREIERLNPVVRATSAIEVYEYNGVTLARAGIISREYEDADRRREELRTARDEAIRQAIADGVSVPDLVRVSGLSRERIYQIRDGRR